MPIDIRGSSNNIKTISSKQDLLVSGTTIKTINGGSILGSGNLCITGSSSLVNFTETSCNIVGAYKTETHRILAPVPDGTTITNLFFKRPSNCSSILTDIKTNNVSNIQATASIDLGYVTTPGTCGLISFTTGGSYSAILSGLDNRVDSFIGSTIVGGSLNLVNGAYSSVSSGYSNKISASTWCSLSYIASGNRNCISGGNNGAPFLDGLTDSTVVLSTILNGWCNTVYYAMSSTILSGYKNCVCFASFGTILNGFCNLILSCNYSTGNTPITLMGKCGQIGSNDTTTTFAIANGTTARATTTDNYNLIFCVSNTGKAVANCLQVLCGTPAVGKVLVSDASGNATWGNASAISNTYTVNTTAYPITICANNVSCMCNVNCYFVNNTTATGCLDNSVYEIVNTCDLNPNNATLGSFKFPKTRKHTYVSSYHCCQPFTNLIDPGTSYPDDINGYQAQTLNTTTGMHSAIHATCVGLFDRNNRCFNNARILNCVVGSGRTSYASIYNKVTNCGNGNVETSSCRVSRLCDLIESKLDVGLARAVRILETGSYNNNALSSLWLCSCSSGEATITTEVATGLVRNAMNTTGIALARTVIGNTSTCCSCFLIANSSTDCVSALCIDSSSTNNASSMLYTATSHCNFNSVLKLQSKPLVGGTGIGCIELNTNAIVIPTIPVTDPHVVGQIWNNNGVLTISAG